MVQAKQLYELQELDNAIQDNQKALDIARSALADSHLVESARKSLDAFEAQMKAIRQEQRDLDLEVQGLADKIQQLEKRLYGGSIVNPKELVSVQEDLKMLRKGKGSKEDGLLELMIKSEGAEGQVKAARAELNQVEGGWQRERERLLKEEESIRRESADLERRRQELSTTLDTRTLSLYKELKAAKGGIAVAKVERGICKGCRMTLPTREIQMARTSQELVRCSSCGRVLYMD